MLEEIYEETEYIINTHLEHVDMLYISLFNSNFIDAGLLGTSFLDLFLIVDLERGRGFTQEVYEAFKYIMNMEDAAKEFLRLSENKRLSREEEICLNNLLIDLRNSKSFFIRFLDLTMRKDNEYMRLVKQAKDIHPSIEGQLRYMLKHGHNFMGPKDLSAQYTAEMQKILKHAAKFRDILPL